jgi:UDP-N-acetylmuramate dehydrogenase
MIDANRLPQIRGEYRQNHALSNSTWFKVGGPPDIFCKPKDVQDLMFFLKGIDKNIKINILGAGSNVIIRDKGVEGIVLKLGRNFTNMEVIDEGKIKIGAGSLNFNAAQFCLENKITGLEFLVGIPGTIGGGIAMNAGAYGSEFKDILEEVTCVDMKGNKRIIKKEDFGFGYRHNSLKKQMVFVEAIFQYKIGDPKTIKEKMDKITSERKLTQPVAQKTGGSTFANPANHKAWELIDKVGLRGHKMGGAMVSPMHCNFMINENNASAKDLEDLGDFVRDKVAKETGIELKWEIKRIGKKSWSN